MNERTSIFYSVFMKKTLLSVLVILLCVGTFVSTRFLLDNKDPVIRVKGTPVLACQVTYDDLLNYGQAEDENLKSFFIEENSLSDIADNRYLTYVAIDSSNNVTKQRVTVDVDSDLTTYHIEALKPLKAQIKEPFKTSEYLALKNECGWNIDESFLIEGVDYSLTGTYEVKVKAKKHSNVEPLYTTMDVDDFYAPKIILDRDFANSYANLVFDDQYFLDFVDHVEDDQDDPEELENKIVVNWREILLPYENGYVTKAGTYTITYRVTDSGGNTGKTTLRLTLQAPVTYSTEGE